MKDKIEKIIDKYYDPDMETFMRIGFVEELSTLIQEERKDALMQFAEWLGTPSRVKKFNVASIVFALNDYLKESK